MPTGFPDMRGGCALGGAPGWWRVRKQEAIGRGDTPINCQAPVQTAHLQIGRDGWRRGASGEDERHESEADVRWKTGETKLES